MEAITDNDGLGFGDEKLIFDDSVSSQDVYYNTHLIGRITRCFKEDKKGEVNYDVYYYETFISILLSGEQLSKLDGYDYKDSPIKGFYHITVDLQNADERFDFNLLINKIYDVVFNVNNLNKVEQSFIKDLKTLMEKYDLSIDVTHTYDKDKNDRLHFHSKEKGIDLMGLKIKDTMTHKDVNILTMLNE